MGTVYLDHNNDVQFDPSEDGHLAGQAAVDRALLTTGDDLACLALVAKYTSDLTGLSDPQALAERLAVHAELRRTIHARIKGKSRTGS